MDIYDHNDAIRLVERLLRQLLGLSRMPFREAPTRSKAPLVEVAEQLAQQRTGRTRGGRDLGR